MITVEADVSDVMAGLDRAIRAGKDLRPLWQQVKPLLRADIHDHFQGRESPEGGWPPLAASTVRRIMGVRGTFRTRGKRKGDLTKRGAKRWVRAHISGGQLGRLKTAFRTRIQSQGMAAVSIPTWSGVHQDGGTAGHGAKIPRRTFMWASDELLSRIAPLARYHITTGFNGGR